MNLSKERRRRIGFLILLGGICAAVWVYERPRPPTPAPPAATPPLPRTPAPRPPAAWLGLDYNSGSDTGALTDFAIRGIVYDREGKVDVDAGTTPENSPTFRAGLETSYAAGMVPDVTVSPVVGPPGCQTNPAPRKICLPASGTGIASFAQGFVTTAASVLRDFPGRAVLFEPTDEPWDWGFPPGTEPGRRTAQEYARLLVELLRASSAASIPLGDIYVPAVGQLEDGTWWIRDLYQAQPCLEPGPGSCGPIAGWNFHAYGLPHSSKEGIGSVPVLRAEMRSGQNNIIVSEIGFCAIDVNNGDRCDENRSDVDGTSVQTAAWLRETLDEAALMHQAGWLKALLVWERSGGGGWAMQNANGTLTLQGRTLDLFADSPGGR